MKELPKEIPQQTTTETNEETPPSKKLGGLLKKVAITTGKVIKKSATTITDTTQNAIQRRRWKDKILIRLEPKQIKQLARENRIRPELVDRPTNDDYIDAIKNEVSLDDIITFAKRNHANIRDILNEIENSKIKEDNKEMLNDGSAVKDFFEQVVEAIKLFKPFQQYDKELQYQIELAAYLRNKFQNSLVDTEKYRKSSRPDITIDGIAIEVKGPTGDGELQTISEKCLRYCDSHPKGVVIVLFKISVSPYRYDDWKRGMNNRFPEVKIIPK